MTIEMSYQYLCRCLFDDSIIEIMISTVHNSWDLGIH